MPTERPNILLVMCDQLNANVLSCYGGPVPTPNIDRLAREGVLFTDATCPTPFCSPSRASLIMGTYPHRHGIVGNVNVRDYPAIGGPPTEEGIKVSDVTTEGLLNAAGYDTHHYGKWHLKEDDLPYYPDTFGEHHEYADKMRDTFCEVRKRPRDQWMEWYGWAAPVTVSDKLRDAVDALPPEWRDRKFADFVGKMGRLDLPLDQVFDVLVARKTVEAIRGVRKPFMITCSFNYPHDPNVVPSPYYDMFDPGAVALPANHERREARFEGDWSRQIVADLGEAGEREFLRIYYASVALVDDQVGKILSALEAEGVLDETIVAFTADHGDMAGGHGMVWKSTSSFYEEIVRIPLVIRYPSALPAQRTDLAACLTDIMPTLLELSGQPPASGIDGHSLVPFLDGRRSTAEAPAYTFSERVPSRSDKRREVAPGTRAAVMVRGNGMKYVRYPSGEEFLYDLAADPGETVNLAGDPGCELRKAELTRELDRWLERTGFPESGVAQKGVAGATVAQASRLWPPRSGTGETPVLP